VLCNRNDLLRFRFRLGKVSVPFPYPNPEPFLTILAVKTKIVQNLAFLMVESALFPRKLSSHLWFLTFALHFMLDPDPKPDPEPNFITVSVSPRQKIPFPVPQHWLKQHWVGCPACRTRKGWQRSRARGASRASRWREGCPALAASSRWSWDTGSRARLSAWTICGPYKVAKLRGTV